MGDLRAGAIQSRPELRLLVNCEWPEDNSDTARSNQINVSTRGLGQICFEWMGAEGLIGHGGEKPARGRGNARR